MSSTVAWKTTEDFASFEKKENIWFGNERMKNLCSFDGCSWHAKFLKSLLRPGEDRNLF